MRIAAPALFFPLVLAHPAPAQEPGDLGVAGRIRAEGFKHSQVMETLWFLTDRYGPRLTNSPQQRRAAEWARDRLTEFGLANAALEPWGEFGLGWSYERCHVSMLEPDTMPLIALPKAWTLGTEGEVRGTPILIEAKTVEDLEQYRGELGGRIVLNGEVEEVEAPFEPLAVRYDAESLAELAAAPELDERDSSRSSRWEEYRRQRAVRDALREMLKEEGAACVIEPDGGRRNDYGVIMLGSGGSRDPEEERALCQVTVSTEQFNRIARLIQHDVDVVMSVDVQTSFYDDDLQGYNVVAEIPGLEPWAEDVVMMGAHFDSWHAATGTTDNGCSSAVVMEAARILKALQLQPRRTIRVALWTGEEQGLLGSRGYVKNHFGDRDTMELLPEHEHLAAYFNLDNGAGKIRGVYLQENAACRPIFAAWLEPFHDLQADTLTIRNTGGTDHLSFDAVGLPGFQFIQDPMDYSSRTHHTNMDTYERVNPTDVKQASVLLASFAWNAANREARLPRKPLPEPREKPEQKPEEEPGPKETEQAEPAPAVPTPAAAPAQGSGSE